MQSLAPFAASLIHILQRLDQRLGRFSEKLLGFRKPIPGEFSTLLQCFEEHLPLDLLHFQV